MKVRLKLSQSNPLMVCDKLSTESYFTFKCNNKFSFHENQFLQTIRDNLISLFSIPKPSFNAIPNCTGRPGTSHTQQLSLNHLTLAYGVKYENS